MPTDPRPLAIETVHIAASQRQALGGLPGGAGGPKTAVSRRLARGQEHDAQTRFSGTFFFFSTISSAAAAGSP